MSVFRRRSKRSSEQTRIWRGAVAFTGLALAATSFVAVPQAGAYEKDYPPGAVEEISDKVPSDASLYPNGDTGRRGDFDGDGRYDEILARNGKWQIMYAKGGSWKTVNTSNVVSSQMRFADFDGDGKDDVFVKWPSGNWGFYSAGTSKFTKLTKSKVAISDLRFFDADGDGKDDVMRYRNGTIQYVPTANVAAGWTHHAWKESTTHCGGKPVTIVATGQRTVGTEGNDVIYMSRTRYPTDTTINGHKTNRHVDGRGGNDIICGNNAANNYIVGGTGNDKLYGGSNNNRLYGGPGNDSISGGPGNDQINGNAGNDAINAGPGNDSAWGESGNDRIWGSGGNDKISGQAGADRLYGGTGNDYLSGGEDDDLIDGNSGSDTLDGGNGNDTLVGHSGNDKLHGKAGTDKLFGGDGDDHLTGDSGINFLDGEQGKDTLTISEDDFVEDTEKDKAAGRDVWRIATLANTRTAANAVTSAGFTFFAGPPPSGPGRIGFELGQGSMLDAYRLKDWIENGVPEDEIDDFCKVANCSSPVNVDSGGDDSSQYGIGVSEEEGRAADTNGDGVLSDAEEMNAGLDDDDDDDDDDDPDLKDPTGKEHCDNPGGSC